MLNGNEERTGGLPKRLLGFVLALSGILVVLWLFVVARAGYDSEQGLPENKTGSGLVVQADTSGRAVQSGELTNTADNDSSGLFGGAATVFVILLVMLGAAFLWFKKSDTLVTTYFHEIGRHQLGINQELVVLEVNDEIWVLGTTGQSVSLLLTCKKEEWQHSPPERVAGKNFKTLFNRLGNNKPWNI